MNDCQKNTTNTINLAVTQTTGKCAVGEEVGQRCIENNKIPVVSCEGACIRGEIARLAANYVAKNQKFARACHGELFTVPHSKISEWINTADHVVCIDGCFLKCHSRILENSIEPAKLIVFDALSYYKKYNDIFDIDDVAENERKEVALSVADWVMKSIEKNETPSESSCCCG